MKPEYVALFVSFGSLLVASLALGWNIYRDLVLKPRLKVSFGIKGIMGGPFPKTTKYIVLSLTNFGPGSIKCGMIFYKKTSLLLRLVKKVEQGFIVHDYRNPLSAQLPCRIEIGEGADFLFPIAEDCILSKDVTHIGIRDSFFRYHWAPKCQVREAVREFHRRKKAEPVAPPDHVQPGASHPPARDR